MKGQYVLLKPLVGYGQHAGALFADKLLDYMMAANIKQTVAYLQYCVDLHYSAQVQDVFILQLCSVTHEHVIYLIVYANKQMFLFLPTFSPFPTPTSQITKYQTGY